MTRSAWIGLWKNDDDHFIISERIDIDSIKEFSTKGKTRIVLKRNRFYQKGTNRPYYLIAFADSYGASSNEITSRELQYNHKFDHTELKELFQALFDEYDGSLTDLIYDLTEERLYTREEVNNCIHGAARDGLSGYDGYDLCIEYYV